MFEFDPNVTWSTIVQAFGFIGAIWGVAYQLGKQRALQEERYRIELKLRTYEKIAADIENSAPTGVATSLRIICGTLDNARKKFDELGKYIPPPFSPDQINNDYREVHSRLEDKIDSFAAVALDIAGLLYDIQVELQNSLLGSFFDRRLPIRAPKDGSLVLTSNNEAMLQRARDYLIE